MKPSKIGIIGGMSYESTIHYYERINRQVNEIKGGLSCAEFILYNVDFSIIHTWMQNNEWNKIGNYLAGIANQLEIFGAKYIVIATNTMHKLADYIQERIDVPLIHIADCVSEKCIEANIYNVGLLGTKHTMQEDFLIERLQKNGLVVHTPKNQEEINEIDRIIFEELCNGKILNSSRDYYLKVIDNMIKEQQINGVILGCTEIAMLLKQNDVNIPLLDTTQAHIDAIVDYHLNQKIKKLTRN